LHFGHSILRPVFSRRLLLFALLPSAFCLLPLPLARAQDSNNPVGVNPNTAARSASVDDVTVSPEADADLRGALAYLAAHQSVNGSWSEKDKFHVAMTSYALIAFMANGHLPDEGPYGKVVAQAVQFLTEQVQPDGILRNTNYENAYMYSHGICAIALAELYGQSHSPVLRTKLEKLLNVIKQSQGADGGWRYQPKPPTASDISVTVNELVALRAAKNAGFDVPQDTIDNGVRFVRACLDAKTGGFTYLAGKGEAGYARTGAAIYALQVCGLYDDPLVASGSTYILNACKSGRPPGSFLIYGSYYCAPGEYMIGGGSWKEWYRVMEQLLLKAARHNGSQVNWDSAGVSDTGGVGPIYATAVFSALLAMPYHYIPLYQR
jgi:hypothetical protein